MLTWENDVELIKKNILFQGFTIKEVEECLSCLQPRVQSFPKGQTVLHQGETTGEFGLLLAGKLSLEKEDYWGNLNIVTVIEPGDVFAEVFAVVPHAVINVNVLAAASSRVLFLAVERLLGEKKAPNVFEARLASNLLALLGRKNLFLSTKIAHLSQRSIREKVLDYFWSLAQKNETNQLILPYNRQQLADYLAVDRSALSKELSRMQEEELLEYHKNKFTLYLQDHS